MQVILLEKVANLGSLGDQVNVKAGYARNYLVPQGKAVLATKKNIAHFESRRVELEKKAHESLNAAEQIAAQIKEIGTIVISSKAGEDGRLFGSIGAKDIADALVQKGISINKSQIRLANGVLRLVGAYDVAIHLHSDVIATTVIEVVAA